MIKKDNLNSSLKHVYNLLTIYPMMKYGDSCKQTTDYIILASKYTISRELDDKSYMRNLILWNAFRLKVGKIILRIGNT